MQNIWDARFTKKFEPVIFTLYPMSGYIKDDII